MPLLSLQNVSLSFGAVPLLEESNLQIEEKEKLAVVGRNGSGKSSLLRLIVEEIEPDHGRIMRSRDLVVGYLPQDIPGTTNQCVGDFILHSSLVQRTTDREHEMAKRCSQFELDPEQNFDHLSGGWKRMVLLARALLPSPNLLVLDEPTNHLDIEHIERLEKMIASASYAVITVSHDRQFINSTCKHTVEIDRGVLKRWQGNYDDYWRRKQNDLLIEARHRDHLDKQIATEEAWLNRGVKARRARNEGRVRNLRRLQQQRRQDRSPTAEASFSMNTANSKSRLVIEAKTISYAYDKTNIVEQFSCRIIKGEKIGILGRNGSGKSTLLKLLCNKLSPLSGNVKIASTAKIAYLDQTRSELKMDANIRDNVSPRDEIEVNEQKLHIVGYLRRFQFSKEQIHAPLAKLSGGELSRVLLAKLFATSFNLLIMDEPTNDLDLSTLELLQQLLTEFSGTLILVSHDRSLLDAVVDRVFVMQEEAKVGIYNGGYLDWKMQHKAANKNTTRDTKSDKKPANTKPQQKLTYKLQRELDLLPDNIDQLERQVAQLQQRMSEPDFYQQEAKLIADIATQLKQMQQELHENVLRWEQLAGLEN